VLKSLREDVESARQANDTAVQKNRKLEQDIPRFAKLRAKQDTLEATIKELQRALPTEAEVPAFFEGIERKMTETGVEVTKWTKLPEESIEAFVKVPLDVEITGTFMQIKRFFASLVEKKQPRREIIPGQDAPVEERERVVSIENLAIMQPMIRNRELILTAKFTAVTFRQADKAPAGPGAASSATAPAPASSPTPSSPSPSASTPPLPSAATPAGAKVRVEDSLQKGEQRDTLKPDPAATGSARLKGGM
jgi:Tfp pilus assembly protein PilO